MGPLGCWWDLQCCKTAFKKMLHLQSKKCTLFIAMFLVAGVELEGHTTSQ